jgi:hypothetical protein
LFLLLLLLLEEEEGVIPLESWGFHRFWIDRFVVCLMTSYGLVYYKCFGAACASVFGTEGSPKTVQDVR